MLDDDGDGDGDGDAVDDDAVDDDDENSNKCSSPQHLRIPKITVLCSALSSFMTFTKGRPPVRGKGNATPAGAPGLAKRCGLIFRGHLPPPTPVGPLCDIYKLHREALTMILKLINDGDYHRKHSTLFSRQRLKG